MCLNFVFLMRIYILLILLLLGILLNASINTLNSGYLESNDLNPDYYAEWTVKNCLNLSPAVKTALVEAVRYINYQHSLEGYPFLMQMTQPVMYPANFLQIELWNSSCPLETISFLSRAAFMESSNVHRCHLVASPTTLDCFVRYHQLDLVQVTILDASCQEIPYEGPVRDKQLASRPSDQEMLAQSDALLDCLYLDPWTAHKAVMEALRLINLDDQLDYFHQIMKLFKVLQTDEGWDLQLVVARTQVCPLNPVFKRLLRLGVIDKFFLMCFPDKSEARVLQCNVTLTDLPVNVRESGRLENRSCSWEELGWMRNKTTDPGDFTFGF